MKIRSIALLAAVFSTSIMAAQVAPNESPEAVVYSKFTELTYVADTHPGPQKGGGRETVSVDVATDWEGTKVVKVGAVCEERTQKVVGQKPFTSSTGVTLQRPDVEHSKKIVPCPVDSSKQ